MALRMLCRATYATCQWLLTNCVNEVFQDHKNEGLDEAYMRAVPVHFALSFNPFSHFVGSLFYCERLRRILDTTDLLPSALSPLGLAVNVLQDAAKT